MSNTATTCPRISLVFLPALTITDSMYPGIPRTTQDVLVFRAPSGYQGKLGMSWYPGHPLSPNTKYPEIPRTTQDVLVSWALSIPPQYTNGISCCEIYMVLAWKDTLYRNA